MNLELKNKVVLITGGSRGIGLAITRAFHDEQCLVAINARTKENLLAVKEELGGHISIHPEDVTSVSGCKNLVDEVVAQWGGVDVLVCNVGSGASVPPGHENQEEWERLFLVNFYATVHMIDAARTALENRGGCIVCISSICGLEVLGAPLTYSVAKAALNSYVKGIARPLAKQGIRINAIAPGNIYFPGGVWDRKMKENKDAVDRMLETDVALRRLGKPEEIANFVVFLSSNRASFATGAILTVDGGQVRS